MKATANIHLWKGQRTRKVAFALVAALLTSLTACTDFIFEDRDGCEHGLWLNLKYDYNLQRTDMLEHVGSVGVFVYNEQGQYVTSFIEPDLHRADAPRPGSLYLDLPEGNYRFLAVGGQRSYEDMLAGPGANFLWKEPALGDLMEDFSVELDHTHLGDDWALVRHEQEPLDTLWHAVSTQPVYVPADRYAEQTLSLMRDTKSISVSLREIDEPETMDVTDYTFAITHRNLYLDYAQMSTGKPVPSTGTRTAIYTPYATWNTTDDDETIQTRSGEAGRTAHADFMTARLYASDDPAEDARLTIRRRDTREAVIEADLCNLLGQLRNYDETRRYTLQEFLDRGYDFRLTFFLKGGKWQYTDVSIGILGWSKRVMNVDL